MLYNHNMGFNVPFLSCLLLQLFMTDAALFGEVKLMSVPDSYLSTKHIATKHHHILREELGKMCEERGLKTAVEVGVQSGIFAKATLAGWGSLTHYYCVDMWKRLEESANYKDGANVSPEQQEYRYRETLENLKSFGDKVIILRNSSLDAATMFPNESLDFIYLDARHDHCGVTDDLNAWWPKLKTGGIMSGHDYLTQAEAGLLSNNNHGDWSVCADGSIHPGAVKGAVQKFANEHNTEIYETTCEWPSWFFSPKGNPKRENYKQYIAPFETAVQKIQKQRGIVPTTEQNNVDSADGLASIINSKTNTHTDNGPLHGKPRMKRPRKTPGMPHSNGPADEGI